MIRNGLYLKHDELWDRARPRFMLAAEATWKNEKDEHKVSMASFISDNADLVKAFLPDGALALLRTKGIDYGKMQQPLNEMYEYGGSFIRQLQTEVQNKVAFAHYRGRVDELCQSLRDADSNKLSLWIKVQVAVHHGSLIILIIIFIISITLMLHLGK